VVVSVKRPSSEPSQRKSGPQASAPTAFKRVYHAPERILDTVQSHGLGSTLGGVVEGRYGIRRNHKHEEND
jgi:hypothetical protein